MSEHKIYTQYGSLKATKASKDHECVRCGLTIPKGDVYAVYTERSLAPGQAFPKHFCLHPKCARAQVRDEYARDIQRVERGLKQILTDRKMGGR